MNLSNSSVSCLAQQVKLSAPSFIDVCTNKFLLDATASFGADGRRYANIVIRQQQANHKQMLMAWFLSSFISEIWSVKFPPASDQRYATAVLVKCFNLIRKTVLYVYKRNRAKDKSILGFRLCSECCLETTTCIRLLRSPFLAQRSWFICWKLK